MKLYCYHDDCDKEWNYKGSNSIQATCPGCGRKVKILKAVNKMDEKQ